MKSNHSLSIFETFKTKREELTGEAKRQRAIIAHLATATGSASKTRTAISQRIAKDHKVVWKNIYSGIFRDLDEILIPLNIVREEGRLPLKRGPKALQEKGIPFYELTSEGLLVSLSLKEISERKKILEKFLSDTTIENHGLQESFKKLAKIAPRFIFSLFEKYTKAYCEGRLDKLLPFNLEKLKKISNDSLRIQREFLEAFESLSKNEKENTLAFLKQIS